MHSASIQPFLLEQQKLERMSYAADRVIVVDGVHNFNGVYEEIHVDEKSSSYQKNSVVIMLQTERRKKRNLSSLNASTNVIIKVMFLAAVARPCFNDNGNCTFDGKIGI